MSLVDTSVEAFFMVGMLESWALQGSKPVIKHPIVGQHYYEYKKDDLKFVMRISDPTRNTHKCDGSISISERFRGLWSMHFSGVCRPDAIPFLQFFHRTELNKKRFFLGYNRTNITAGEYRYTCNPKSDSCFLSFEGTESIRFEEEVITRFSYRGRFHGADTVTTREILMTAG